MLPLTKCLQLKSLIFILTLAFSPTASAINAVSRSVAPIVVTSRGQARTFSGHRVQINLYVPNGSGPLTIQVMNQSSFNIGSLEFDLSVLGATGNIRFSSIAVGSEARNIINVPSTRELAVRDILVFDADANEKFPRTVIQIIWPASGQSSS